MKLHRFWFKFSSIPLPNSLRLGCGVTAYNYDDALVILQETVFSSREFPEIESFVADVDISDLDQKHVIPNMEAPVWLGVWFPKGYAQTS